LWGVSSPPFIAWIGQFPGEFCMETTSTARRIKAIFPPKMCVPRGHPGSAELGSAEPRWRLPDTTFISLAGRRALMLILGGSHPGKAVCFARWALESMCLPLIGWRCVSWPLGLTCFGMWAIQFSCSHRMLCNVLFPLFEHCFPPYADTVSCKQLFTKACGNG
jgi:hypothetical protein